MVVGLVIIYLICCVLGFFEVDYPYTSGIKYWQSRYDFSNTMCFEWFGWILTLLAFLGFPGMFVGLIRAIIKESFAKAELQAEEENKKAEINKFKNSKVIDELAGVIQSNNLEKFTLSRYGITGLNNWDPKYFMFNDHGLPDLPSREAAMGIAEGLVKALGEGWSCENFYFYPDYDEHSTEGVRVTYRKPTKDEPFKASRSW